MRRHSAMTMHVLNGSASDGPYGGRLLACAGMWYGIFCHCSSDGQL